MKQDESAGEENETPVLREVDQFLQIEGVVALGGIARAYIIDFVAWISLSAIRAGMHNTAAATNMALFEM